MHMKIDVNSIEAHKKIEKMPHPCIVCGRSRMNPNNRQEEYIFFGFPVADEERCKKWLEFCCREDLYKLTRKQLLQRMVCSKHFEQKDFLNEYLDRLNCTAVPSIYDPSQSLYNIICALCGRSRRDPSDPNYDGVTFHHFPGEEFRCLKWLDFVGVESYYRLTRKEILFCYICSKHFDSSQFMQGYKGRLVDNAVPNIRHPDRDTPPPFLTELVIGPKLFDFPERIKKSDPFPPAVMESQACAACGRSRSDPKNKIERYKFHPFPAYEIGRCLKWCQFLDREDLLKMSPNQIRKLVLCSKHFQTGQSFNKVGPSDAVPTIKNLMNHSDEVPEQLNSKEVIVDVNGTNVQEGIKKVTVLRPLVSSKKPKVENKPTPLAKKRGKCKRPTSINIPKPKSDPISFDYCVKKLPLPSTSSWNIQFIDQLQPVTITNNVIPTDTIAGNIKKLILPFTGDISNLGAPIPVHSLSSMPPGLLIKINLPEQEQQKLAALNKKQNKTKNSQGTVIANDIRIKQDNRTKKSQTIENNQIIVTQNAQHSANTNIVELMALTSNQNTKQLNTDEAEIQEETMIPDILETLVDENVKKEKEDHYYAEYEEVVEMPPKMKSSRKKLSATARRTIFPIQNEVKQFLHKLRPLMHRLPRKARAQIKLSIVNMVIDRL